MGPELVTNGTFDTDLSGWTLSGVPLWESGRVNIRNGTAIFQTLPLVSGLTYELAFDYYRNTPFDETAIRMQYVFGLNQDFVSTTSDTPQHFSQLFTITDADIASFSGIDINGITDAGSTALIDNVSVRLNQAIPPVYSTSLISAVVRAQQGLGAPSFVIGGRGGVGGTTYGLFKKSSSYVFNQFKSDVFKPQSSPFVVREIQIPLAAAIAADMEIIPALYFDSESVLSVGTPLNPTNYAGSEHFITLTADNFPDGAVGEKDFYLSLSFTGTALLPVSIPISILVEAVE